MKRATACLLLLVLTADLPLWAGLGSDKSMYVGGTITTLSKEKEGIMSTDDPATLKFSSSKENWSVPYDKVSSLEYGQHAGRRVGTTIALGVTTLGIGALPVLFSKKRRHYLTIEYVDDQGKNEAGVFEVGKGAIRTLLASLQARTGKKVEYEDEEARKAGSK